MRLCVAGGRERSVFTTAFDNGILMGSNIYANFCFFLSYKTCILFSGAFIPNLSNRLSKEMGHGKFS